MLNVPVLEQSYQCSNGSFLDKHGFISMSLFLVSKMYCLILNKPSLGFQEMNLFLSNSDNKSNFEA